MAFPVVIVCVVASSALAAADRPSQPWRAAGSPSSTIADIPAPQGYTRVPQPDGSFGAWLRALPLKPGEPVVFLFDGRTKRNQGAQHAVLDVDVGARDLQQCADATIRLRAEYLFSAARDDDICFRFTSGDPSSWSRHRDGWRPVVNGRRVRFERSAAVDDSYPSFRRYLDTVFEFAGSASLVREMKRVTAADVQAGDVFIKGGYPGHAVMVVDVARNEAGRPLFLLVQSYMPAQDIHVLRNDDDKLSPWYALPGDRLVTPEWTFERGSLHRFPSKGCAR